MLAVAGRGISSSFATIVRTVSIRGGAHNGTRTAVDLSMLIDVEIRLEAIRRRLGRIAQERLRLGLK